MRKFLMMAGAAALAVSAPALAKPGGGKGGGGDGGPKAAQGGGGGHGGGGHGGGHRGGGGGEWKAPKAHKAHGGDFARQEFRSERKAERKFARAERNWERADRKPEKQWRKAEAKADRQWAKQERKVRAPERRFREEERRFAARDGRDGRERRYREEVRYGAASGMGCPPGLAMKGNGCLPPGQAKKMYRLGERLPLAAFAGYNLPGEYRDWYGDNPQYSYRSDDGYIYRVDNRTNLVSGLIPLLGGGFGVGNLLPAGYDVYNLPTQYRDDYHDTADANYRYGDEAIYQVDPQTQMIESVVALLSGDLNVGQMLPTGYDTYNLPMNYRDRYQDSDDAMYRYADGNIYEVDPQSRMIEAIVAQLV